MGSNAGGAQGGLDGLGGDGQLQPGQILEGEDEDDEPVPFGMAQQPVDGLGEQANGNGAAPAAPADPWAALGNGASEMARAKGWSSPADMAASYRALEQRLSEMGQQQATEREQFLGLVEQMRQQPAAPAQQQAPGQQIDFAGMVADLEGSGGNAGHAINFLMNELVPQMVEERVQAALGTFSQQHVAPVASTVQQLGLRQQAAHLASAYGPLFRELQADAIEELRRDATLQNHPRAMELAFATVHARKSAAERQQSAEQQRRERGVETLDGGGRGPAPAPAPDLAEQMRQAIMGAGGRINDGLG